jgi:hypothetical protein
VSASGHAVLEAGRVQAGMSFDDLWLEYFALGGTAPPEELRDYLAGGAGPMDYDVVAQAINERFVDRGEDHPVPYSEELDSGP